VFYFAWIDYLATERPSKSDFPATARAPCQRYSHTLLMSLQFVQLDNVYAGFTGVGRMGTDIDLLA